VGDVVTPPPTDAPSALRARQLEAGDAEGRRSRLGGRPLEAVRGVVAERVVVSTPANPYLDMKALADYSSLSVRKLRDHLADPTHPLPSYRVGGKVLVRRGDFDEWIERFRHRASTDVARIVDAVLRDL
jgi:hypothetical protein